MSFIHKNLTAFLDLLKFVGSSPLKYANLINILEYGLKHEQLRDEIYMQIIRQTNSMKFYSTSSRYAYH